ncbi:MAG: hypothetical protein IKD69_16355 [Solobacterium sp.]|nr:hypothetical protein [Solobacterium sp.]
MKWNERMFVMMSLCMVLSILSVHADIAVDPIRSGLPVALLVGIAVVVILTVVLVIRLFRK